MARHPLTPMTDPDLVRFLGRQTARARRARAATPSSARGRRRSSARLGELRGEGVSYAVADAVEDDDLRAIGAACAGLPLVVGGSGVALGLPENFRRRGLLGRAAPPEPRAVDGPAVVLAGSCSAATQEQVAPDGRAAPGDQGRRRSTAGGTTAPSALAAAALARSARPGARLLDARRRRSPRCRRASASSAPARGRVAARRGREAARRRAARAASSSRAARRPAPSCSALGVRALAVGPEIAPGVPWMTSLGEPRLALALKSGNFGGPDFFLEAVGTRRDRARAA